MGIKVDEKRESISIDTTYTGPADFRVLVKEKAKVSKVIKNRKANLAWQVKRIGESIYVHFVDRLTSGSNIFELRKGR